MYETESLLKMKKTIVVSSPGKLILAGEHAVVYGRRALVTSVGMRLFMQLTVAAESSESRLIVTFHDTKTQHTLDPSQPTDASPLEVQAVLFVYEQFKASLPTEHHVELQVRSDIPIGAGLGSSAAFSVSLVSCFYLLEHEKIDREAINRLAFQVERLFHETPSGIDNTIVTYGQSLLYSQASKKHVSFRLPNLAIIDTGIPKSTKVQIGKLRQFVDKNPAEAETIFQEIECCVDAMIEQVDRMPELFQRNQQLLVRLGASIPAIDRIVEVLSKQNIASKITGAGGGGCLIASVSSTSKEELVDMLKENSVRSIYVVQCGVEGVREEKTFCSSS